MEKLDNTSENKTDNGPPSENPPDNSPSDNSPPDCAICLEPQNVPSPLSNDDSCNIFKLLCSHTFHTECLEGLISLKCPLCRSPLLNIPKNIRKRIIENRKKYNEQNEVSDAFENNDNPQDYDEYENLMREVTREQSKGVPLQVEIESVIEQLYNAGVPSIFFPKQIDIDIPLDYKGPRITFGYISHVVVNAIDNNMFRIMQKHYNLLRSLTDNTLDSDVADNIDYEVGEEETDINDILDNVQINLHRT
jgi:hypothetical protein